MSRLEWPRPRRPQGPLRAVLVGGGLAALGTLPAAAPADISTAGAALIYVLAVATAALVAGRLAGVTAALCSFLTLNFLFTPPYHTFAVGKTEDLIALFVFLAVALVMGSLLSSAITNRSLSERRELETRLLNRAATRLLGGEGPQPVLEDFASAIADMFGLAECLIEAPLIGAPVSVVRNPETEADRLVIPIHGASGQIGEIAVRPGAWAPIVFGRA